MKYTFFSYSQTRIDEAKASFLSSGKTDPSQMSLLEKMVDACGPDSSVPFVMAFDMCIAGVDTAGNYMACWLGRMAENPDKQEGAR